jgi:Tfp pilus assembly protein PilN
MIELNLLPDVKLEYIKAQRQRRLVMSVSILVTAVSVGLLLLLLSVGGLQKKHLNDLSDDIVRESSQLQQKKDINKILTVQNQLNSLTGLHDAKPAAKRLFEYLNQVTPTEVDITSLDIDYTAQTISITGTSDALASVNKYVDTLKFTKYTVGSDKTTALAFSNIVLASFGVGSNSNSNGHNATYNVTLAYNPDIFDVTKTIKLAVPSQVTTRSEVDQPKDLFQDAPKPAANAQTGSN